MNRQDDVVVIGGGIIGLSAAYYLALQGRSVTLIEKDEVGAGSSYGNAGLIANGFVTPTAAPGVPLQGLKWLFDASSPFYIKPRLDLNLLSWLWQFQRACNEKTMRTSTAVLLALGQGSFDLFDELFAKETMHFGYEHKGRLILFTSESGFDSGAAGAAKLREFGVETTLLDAQGVRRMEPNVLPSVTHGIYCPDYAHVDPGRFVQEMARLAETHGVKLKTGTAITGFETEGRRITGVMTTGGTLTPGHVVLAAGAWSPVIARGLGLKLPIQPAKGYSLTYKRPAKCPQLPLSLSERKIAVTPMGEILRFTSTLELVGYDPALNQRRLAAIRSGVNEYLPGMEALEQERAWSGFRPSTPDDLPIIGRSRRVENLVLATGHGMLGVTHGLVTGKLVAQIMTGESPMLDIAPFRPDRF